MSQRLLPPELALPQPLVGVTPYARSRALPGEDDGAMVNADAVTQQESVPAATEPNTPQEAFERWYADVWRNLRRRGVPDAALEDATQEVFLHVCRKWTTFKGKSKRRTWVLGFAWKLARGFRGRGPEGADVEQQPTGRLLDDPFAATLLEAAKHKVDVFMSGLDPIEKELLLMVDVEGFTIAEAADQLGVGRRAYRMLEKVRGDLDAYAHMREGKKPPR